jgi:two-component system LytT family response regulator
MRVLLVDDETSARRRLARLLAAFPDVELVGEAQDGLDALAVMESTKPDLVFLDIRMPELDGFGVIRAYPQTAKMPLIIFATSYDDHALEAFEANAIAYLLKPVETERLRIALERARRLLGSEQDRFADEERIHALADSSKRLHRIVCRERQSPFPARSVRSALVLHRKRNCTRSDGVRKLLGELSAQSTREWSRSGAILPLP